MAKKYSFQFLGTKEDFLRSLSKYQNDHSNFYYLDEYIVSIENGECKFGVARGGHSGGYWYLPEITEKDGSLCFSGKIQYISPYSPEKGIKKVMNTIEKSFLFIILLPLILITRGCLLIVSLFKKQKGIPKEATVEDKLFDLMVNHLHCNMVSEADRNIRKK
ncbi:MAG: hypothetical protein MR284_04155 [Clostridiales bacterium]|nr:hypothetical protein [Clostridiales bacterium]